MSIHNPFKVLRSLGPDVTINVGTGAYQRDFLCYKVVLSLGCDYFDDLFTRDKERDRIEFPDMDPMGWELFYKYIYPYPGGSFAIEPLKVKDLLPWFLHFNMDKEVLKCDQVLSLYVVGCFHYSTGFVRSEHILRKVKNKYDEALKHHQTSKQYDLRANLSFDRLWKSSFEHLNEQQGIFDEVFLKGLICLEAPLEQTTNSDGARELVMRESFWSHLPLDMKERLTKYPKDSLHDTDALASWIATCIELHQHIFCKRSNDEDNSSGDEEPDPLMGDTHDVDDDVDNDVDVLNQADSP